MRWDREMNYNKEAVYLNLTQVRVHLFLIRCLYIIDNLNNSSTRSIWSDRGKWSFRKNRMIRAQRNVTFSPLSIRAGRPTVSSSPASRWECKQRSRSRTSLFVALLECVWDCRGCAESAALCRTREVARRSCEICEKAAPIRAPRLDRTDRSALRSDDGATRNFYITVVVHSHWHTSNIKGYEFR